MSLPPQNPLAAEFYARFYRDGPQVLLEEKGYAILYKPHNMHSAPLREDEGGSLLRWYLSRPDAPDGASRVLGRKPVERGLLHRLDFATAGLVLLAKSQAAFDFLRKAQAEGRFVKHYRAFCDCMGDGSPSQTYREGTSLCVKSRFRPFGPAGREVRPVFSLDGAARKGKRRLAPREYSTGALVEEIAPDGKFASVLCTLSLGFRHQVRAHLASIGLPICGDALYNPLCKPHSSPPGAKGGKGGKGFGDSPPFMQLIAVSLSFPDPQGASQVSFSLPQASKTSL